MHLWILLAAGLAHAGPGRVIGRIDGIQLHAGEFSIVGWACQQGIDEPIDLHVYADHSAYDSPPGTLVLRGTADLPSEPSVAKACQDRGGRHRFQIALSRQFLVGNQGRKLYVHGIRNKDGVPNAALDGSATLAFPGPPLAGTYTSRAEHPRVFLTQSDLKELVGRINKAGSFSAMSLARLAAESGADLKVKKDWEAVYSGCDLDIYLHAFSYEPEGGYTGEIRSESVLRAAMHPKAGLGPPNGAAIVAARLALYAALVAAGAHAAPPAPAPDQAAALAKRILLAWASRGFRNRQGVYLNAASQFCDARGESDFVIENGVGLQVGRGVIYSAHAQDLLQSIGALTAAETTELNAFHAAMFDLVRVASNTRAAEPQMNQPNTVCEHFSNHVAAHLIGLMSIARLLDDGRRFNAVVYGTDRGIPLAIPWTNYFHHAIYGENDRPIPCYKNPGRDSLTSHPSFQTPVVAPGEIEDRYRHEGTLQAFGYPMGVLQYLFEMAEIMKSAGIDAYGYRGAHKQSIEMAAQYYACYGKYVGFRKIVTAENGRACADYEEYVGQLVNDVEAPVLMGAYRFPRNAAVTEMEAAAKAETMRDPLDPIRFGRWRD